MESKEQARRRKIKIHVHEYTLYMFIVISKAFIFSGERTVF